MGSVVSYFEHKRRAGGSRVRHIDPVIAEVLEALLVLGGSAHRQAVADQVLLRRSGRTGPPDAEARSVIYTAFEAHITWAASRKAPPLLDRPLGSGSYRWALTDAGQRLFQPLPSTIRVVR